jgi:uncharacterized glyoxalase superfamily protein PhnB
MRKITPFLWFDNNAEEAVQFYTSIFRGEMLKSKQTDKTHRMLKALWQMQKLDIKRLKAAFDGRE